MTMPRQYPKVPLLGCVLCLTVFGGFGSVTQSAAAQTFDVKEIETRLTLPVKLPDAVGILLGGSSKLRKANKALHRGRKFQDNQEYEAAIAAYRKAIDRASASRKDGNTKDSILAAAYAELGDLYLKTGEYSRAVTAYDEAQFYKPFNFYNASTDSEAIQTALGFAQFRSGNLTAAEATLRQLIFRAEVFNYIPTLDDLFGGSKAKQDQSGVYEFLRSVYVPSTLLQVILVERGNFDAALEIADRTRASVLVESLLDEVDEDIPISSGIGVLRQKLDALALTLPDMQQLASELSTTLVVYSKVGQETLYIWVIRPDQPLAFRTVDWSQSQRLDSPPEPSLVPSPNLSPDTNPGLNTDPSPDRLDTSPILDTVVATRASLSRSIAVVTGEDLPIADSPRADAQVDLQAAYQLLIAPIADLLPNEADEQVLFVPHQELFLMPFAALRSPEGDYLIDRVNIALSPSLQTLTISQKLAQRPPPANPRTLVFSNPDPMPDGLPPLLGAVAEGRAIAGLQPNVSLLSGSHATEANLHRLISSARTLHFATHGVLDEEQSRNSWLAMADTGAGDGKLTVKEIFRLKLNADLVVLSACETGAGEITGEGILGMTRAFMNAGAATVGSSLWRIPDEPTAVLMTAFHREMGRGEPKSSALRTAMIETRQQYPDPSHWAGFVLMGNPQ